MRRSRMAPRTSFNRWLRDRFSQRVAAAVALAAAGGLAVADEPYEREPIDYWKTPLTDAVTRFKQDLESGDLELDATTEKSWLRGVLAALKVPESSQVMVFSKTSLQRNRISPDTPRVLYFNDEVYVGYCQDGEVLEISVADPQLGAVFYSLAQDADDGPKLVRQGDNCLICHGSSPTRNVPGHLLRSVFVHPSGEPILSAATHRINQTNPLDERWGGWYVTGTHGPQKHLGNLVIQSRDVPDNVDNSAGMNLTALGDRFDATAYATVYSDIVALLVLEHQAEAQNLITQANFTTRQALHYQVTLNRELGEPADHVWDSVTSRIRNVGERLIQYLLFSGEAKLTHRVAGTSGFAEEFAQQGPRDRRGRSLRDFDLQRRLFRYPCSYLVYTPSFQSLPDEVRNYVYVRLWNVLSGQDQTKPFEHLTPDDRQAILEILRDTIPNLPNPWPAPKPTTQPSDQSQGMPS